MIKTVWLYYITLMAPSKARGCLSSSSAPSGTNAANRGRVGRVGALPTSCGFVFNEWLFH